MGLNDTHPRVPKEMADVDMGKYRLVSLMSVPGKIMKKDPCGSYVEAHEG